MERKMFYRSACVVFSVFLGIAALVQLGPVLQPWMALAVSGCIVHPNSTTSSNPYIQLTNLHPSLDFFLCFTVQFFQDSLVSKSGFILNCMFIPFFVTTVVLMTVESTRRRGYSIWPAFVIALGQLFGISTTFPFFWVSASVLFSSPSRRSEDYIISTNKLSGAFTMLFFGMFPTIAMFTSKNELLSTWSKAVTPFVTVIPGLLLTIIPTGGEDKTSLINRKRQVFHVCNFYYTFAGIGAGFYFLGLLEFLTDPANTFMMILTTFLQPSITQTTELFLWIDFAVTFLSVFVFIMWESSFLKAVEFVVLGALFSPGMALAWFAIAREESIVDQIANSENIDKKKQ